MRSPCPYCGEALQWSAFASWCERCAISWPRECEEPLPDTQEARDYGCACFPPYDGRSICAECGGELYLVAGAWVCDRCLKRWSPLGLTLDLRDDLRKMELGARATQEQKAPGFVLKDIPPEDRRRDGWEVEWQRFLTADEEGGLGG